MKTILFVYETPFHPERGGVERVGDILSRSLIDRGYEIKYLCVEYPENYKGFNYPAELFVFPNKDIYSIENQSFYTQILIRHNIDIIVNHSCFKNCILFLNQSKRLGIKTISVIHNAPGAGYDTIYKLRDNTLEEYLRILPRIIIWHFKGVKRNIWRSWSQTLSTISESSDVVCLLSKTFIDDYIRLAPETPYGKLAVMPNPNTYSVLQALPKKSKQLLYVGRLHDGQKRARRLILIWRRIYKQFPDWELIIVGDGEARGKLEHAAKGIDRVTFVGFRDPQPYYERASIFCMTSDYEGFPMVLTEAMVHGVVPIAFNSFSSVTDIIEDGKSGVLVKPFSLTEYARKLSALMRDNHSRETMAQYAQRSVERYNIEKITDMWEEQFQYLIKGTSNNFPKYFPKISHPLSTL